VDAPHAREAEFAGGAGGVVGNYRTVLDIGRHIMGGDLAMRMTYRNHLQLRPYYERVRKLPGRTHRAGRNRAIVAGDEIHDAERQALHLGQGGDLVGLVQRAVGFDQHVDGQELVEPAPGFFRRRIDHLLRAQHIGDAVGLGDHHVGQLPCRRADDVRDIACEVLVADVVQAHADAPALGTAGAGVVQQARHQLGMFAFLAGGSAVLAVEGDVEDGPKLLLQGHRLAHQLLAAGVMVAGGEQQRLALSLE
jgi:hypothetical protein